MSKLKDGLKRCRRCSKALPVSDFHRNRSTRDGLQTYCKTCSNEVRREYEARNAEAIALKRAERMARAPVEGVKVCTKCGLEKRLLEFYVHRSTRDGRATHCIDCQKAATRAWNESHREQIRKRNAADRAKRPKGESARHQRRFWLKLYGLTPEQYDDLHQQQNGVCAICLRPEQYIDPRNGEPRRLAVDHDHRTGKVRGLLCGRCNRSIGQFSDDHEVLARAAQYLIQAADM